GIDRLSYEDGSCDRSAVQHIVLVTRPVSIDAQVAVVPAAVARGLLRRACGERDQAEEVPAGRQLLDLLLGHCLAEIRLLRLKERRLGYDIHGLRGGSDLQHEIDL